MTRMIRMSIAVAVAAVVLAIVVGSGIGFLFGHFIWTPKQTSVSVQRVPVMAVTPAPQTVVVSPAPACQDRKYTVVKGDSLWRIAKREYGGRAYLYLLIEEVNKLENSDLIHPGLVITIPCCLCDLPSLPEKVVTAKKTTAKVVVAKVVVIKKNWVSKKVATPAPAPVPQVQVPVPAPVPVAQPAPAPAPAPVATPPAPVAQVPPPAQPVVEKAPGLVIPAPAPVNTPAIVPAPSLERKQAVPVFVRTAPGSIWNSFGISPIEKGNKVDYFHVDQGVVLGQLPGRIQLQPYVAVNATKDSKGYSWNNKVKTEVGVKLVKAFSQGVVSVGGAYASETRKSDPGNETKSGFMLYTDGWFGWDQSSPSTRGSVLSSLPGSGWYSVGNTSPFEQGNVIGIVRVEQGVTLARTKRLSFIPDVWGQAGFDTDDRPWNNRYIYGGGMKVAIPWSGGVFSVTGGYECARERGNTATSSGSNSTCGPKVSVDIWTGWRKKIGGN